MKIVDEIMTIQQNLTNKLLIKKSQAQDMQKEVDEARKKVSNADRYIVCNLSRQQHFDLNNQTATSVLNM